VRDTDGQPGNEIVIHVRTGASRGVHIIRPRTGVVKAYVFAANFTEITGAANLDGQPGDEISVRHGTHGKATIIDRTGTLKIL
jgi:hypothetical protein